MVLKMNNELFPKTTNKEKYNKEMQRPAARKTFLIFFTARSGSSWLTDICKRSGRLSFPDEGMNPAFIPNMASALNASNMDEYLNILRRRRNTHGVYGVQMTYHHLRALFDTEDEFMSYFGTWKMFWLVREDIILQALSLMKMQQTQITHQAHSTTEERKAAEQGFVYSARQIKKWINHNYQAERMNENLFKRYGLSPLRLSYEGITSAGAHKTVNAFAHHIGIPSIPNENLASDHGRIRTEKNQAFAARFRAENADYVKKLEEDRSPWLEQINRCPPTGLQ